ncbi:glycosyltransferase family 2 protein [Arundinibacter roseus]|uniref:Glycosyltransferase n=1 Tax=Arundinibacter roseus TaxID=2070510 RepID=A0A4R4K9R8_9BACT|nr:glycosyltransferase family 2 protein [Arundinibacter roseus]TDB64498.1 glycosyltransferase [Arundinibacter roseus]
MKISIITVVYNGEKTIRDTINSVLSQDYSDLEYIVVDGKSDDSTVAIIQSFGNQITKFISEKDQGIYDAMNKGISLATGDVIGLLNADDFYASNSILSEVAQKFRESDADAVYGDLDYINVENPMQITRSWKAGPYKHNYFMWGWMPPHPTFFIKKEWYTRFGGFRLDLNTAADYELMLRMIHKLHAKPVYIQKVLVKMRAGGASNNSLHNRLLANQSDAMAWKVNDIKPYFFTIWLKPIRKILQFFV